MHSAAKLHGIGNLMKRFFGTTRTADNDCAETQYATENALSNPYAFDLAEQSLQRVAANQACLNQHTLVCDGELRSPSLDYGDEPGHEHSDD